MKLPERFFSRLLLAYLPFLSYPYDLFRMGVAASWVVAFLWITVTFFWMTRPCFPGRTLRPAFFLWLIVWGQAVWTLTQLAPLWLVSVFFLMPVSFLEDRTKPDHVRIFSRRVPRYFFERVAAGLGFVAFVMVMTVARDLASVRFGVDPWGIPAGIFLAITLIAFLWKNQPYGRRS